MKSSSGVSPTRNFSASLSKSSNSRSSTGMTCPGTFSSTSGFSSEPFLPLRLGSTETGSMGGSSGGSKAPSGESTKIRSTFSYMPRTVRCRPVSGWWRRAVARTCFGESACSSRRRGRRPTGGRRRSSGSMRVRGSGLAGLLLLSAVPPAASAVPAQVRDYDVGRVVLPDPSPIGPLPVRLWGAIGAPTTPGPHPLVVVLHGRHGDNCPAGMLDGETWPCFRRERRNDLGLRHVVRALAERGMIALAPDLNAAFTGGWGEPNDRLRWPLLVNRVLAEVARETRVGGGRFGIDLLGRGGPRRLGLLGHSLSRPPAVQAAQRRERNDSPATIARGRGPVRALFLLAPVFARAPLPDRPTPIVLGSSGTEIPPRVRRRS